MVVLVADPGTLVAENRRSGLNTAACHCGSILLPVEKALVAGLACRVGEMWRPGGVGVYFGLGKGRLARIRAGERD